VRYASSILSLLMLATACVTASGRQDRQLLEKQRADVQTLEARIAALDVQMVRLRARLDSLEAQNDSLRRSSAKTEMEILGREEQIRALRLELLRLKEIDLRPRRP